MKVQVVRASGSRWLTDFSKELVLGKYTHVRRRTVAEFKEYEESLQYFHDDCFSKKPLESIANHRNNEPLLLITTFLPPHPRYSIPELYFSKTENGDLETAADVGQWHLGQSSSQSTGIRYLLHEQTIFILKFKLKNEISPFTCRMLLTHSV